MACEAPTAMVLYSASEDDLETALCFFDFQVIGETQSNKIYPVIDFLPNQNLKMLVNKADQKLLAKCLGLLRERHISRCGEERLDVKSCVSA